MSGTAGLADFPWRGFFAALSFVWGTCMGSFLNVCIYRIPLDLSVVSPRSFCPSCRRQIPAYLNVPILSWLMLRGRCRFCGTRISPRYVGVELLVGILFLLVWLKYDLCSSPRMFGLAPMSDWRLVPVLWLAVSGLVLGTFVDFEHFIIPDRVTLGGIVAGLSLSALVPSLHGETEVMRALLWSSLGAALGWGLLWATATVGEWLFKKEAMGFGDVKLMGAIGAFLGSRAVFFTILASSLIGSLVGLTLVMTGRRQMQSRIPFGPYLSLGALLWMLWGPVLWRLYVTLASPARTF
ncbi:MAG: prepilin peptidase [Lentisphaerae bacterium]|nr:prepilin peptidase [Lentisphaerota bacterium]